jgi:hypothetical protein
MRARLAEWGYPRALDEVELLAGHWFAYGDSAVFWIIADGSCADGEAGLHVCVAPAMRGRYDVDAFFVVLRVVAQLCGVCELVVGTRTVKPGVLRLLARKGWTKRGERWYFSVYGRFQEAEETEGPA